MASHNIPEFTLSVSGKTGFLHRLISCYPEGAGAVIVISLLLFCFNGRHHCCLLICLFVCLNRNALSQRVLLSLEAVIVLCSLSRLDVLRATHKNPHFLPAQIFRSFPLKLCFHSARDVKVYRNLLCTSSKSRSLPLG